MYTLGSDEKATIVMAYTQDSLIRGEAVTKQAVRVSTWFRTDGAPDYLHLHNLQWIAITGAAIKPLSFPEMFLPISTIIGFHIVPPASDLVDYDEKEANRINTLLSILMGKFLVQGKLRVSTQSDVGTTLSISHSKWMSIYDAEISSPYVPQMPMMKVPMLIVRPMEVNFILSA
jgi:hypothetical protein